MNRGFKTYFKEGVKTSKKTLLGKGNFLRFYLSEIMSFFGKIIFFLFLPFFILSDVRVARQASKDNKIVVSKSYQSSDNIKSYWTSFLVFILEILLFIGGVIIISAIYGACAMIAYFIMALFKSGYELFQVLIVMSVPFGVIAIVYFILFFVIFSPSFYIIDAVDGIGASDVIFKSIESMRRTGKRVIIINAIVNYLVRILSLALIAVVYILFTNSSSIFGVSSYETAETLFYVGCLLSFILILVYLFFRPFIVLSYRNTKTSLYDDMILDKYNTNLRCQGINIKSSTMPRSKFQDEKEMLISLFDDVEEQHEPVLKDQPILVDEDPNVKEAMDRLIEKYQEDIDAQEEEARLASQKIIENEQKEIKEEPKESKHKEPIQKETVEETSVQEDKSVEEIKSSTKKEKSSSKKSFGKKIKELFVVKGEETLFDNNEVEIKASNTPVEDKKDGYFFDSENDDQENIEEENEDEINDFDPYKEFNSVETKEELVEETPVEEPLIEEKPIEDSTELIQEENIEQGIEELPQDEIIEESPVDDVVEEVTAEETPLFEEPLIEEETPLFEEEQVKEEDNDFFKKFASGDVEDEAEEESKPFSFTSAFNSQEDEDEEIDDVPAQEESKPFSFSSAFASEEDEEEKEEDKPVKKAPAKSPVKKASAKTTSKSTTKKDTWEDQPLKLKSIHKQDK